jgi:hypothetical protein
VCICWLSLTSAVDWLIQNWLPTESYIKMWMTLQNIKNKTFQWWRFRKVMCYWCVS